MLLQWGGPDPSGNFSILELSYLRSKKFERLENWKSGNWIMYIRELEN